MSTSEGFDFASIDLRLLIAASTRPGSASATSPSALNSTLRCRTVRRSVRESASDGAAPGIEMERCAVSPQRCCAAALASGAGVLGGARDGPVGLLSCESTINDPKLHLANCERQRSA
jgi:hypothetical protein